MEGSQAEGWDLFEDAAQSAAPPDRRSANDAAEVVKGPQNQLLHGIPADEHPYFKSASPGAVPDLKACAEESVLFTCDMLMMEGTHRRALAANLKQAWQAVATGDLTASKDAAGCAAGEAWGEICSGSAPPSEALLYSHAWGHAFLAHALLLEAKDLQGAVRHADLALLFCMDLPLPALPALAAECSKRLRDSGLSGAPPTAEGSTCWQVVEAIPKCCQRKVPVIASPISRCFCHDISVAAFRQEYLVMGQPVVLANHLHAAGWAALQRWPKLDYWLREHGHRSIPIEIGLCEDDAAQASLLRSPESEGSMLLAEFVTKFLLPSNKVLAETTLPCPDTEKIDEWSAAPVAYMAQHLLLTQIPELRSDITVPHYCSLGVMRTVNVWMGTAGTVTALHYDSDDNFLAQVAGFKYVRLYQHDEAPRLYATQAPRRDPRQHGESFSPVRVEAPDLEAHPEFPKAKFTETILGPGDSLFIPKLTWHYVRAITTSISVNFWFS